MGETCKTCKKQVNEGIWLSPQFSDEKVLLFCSNQCKLEHIKDKLNRIKGNYPTFYDNIIKSIKENKKDKAIDDNWKMLGEIKHG